MTNMCAIYIDLLLLTEEATLQQNAGVCTSPANCATLFDTVESRHALQKPKTQLQQVLTIKNKCNKKINNTGLSYHHI